MVFGHWSYRAGVIIGDVHISHQSGHELWYLLFASLHYCGGLSSALTAFTVVVTG